ncbi:ABC transporter ATP-binding protein [Arthrobacter alkaliphilus]|uniref:ABC transporter ATP-binding protein n=1 Tax=Arthrobacter alkaliphilus TaxID=369936 RepID=UPI001F33AC41|nr:ABC transporter ATP-binding protein [Arthrobacter alkaliphilus]
MGIATLHVEKLSFNYRREPVLRDITLPPLQSGKITAVIGPNAAGKSTLLRCIAGFHKTTGHVRFSEDVSSHRSLRDRILYLPQDPPPRSSITVFGAVELAHRLGGGPHRTQDDLDIAMVLARLGLENLATRRLSDLSGGQRQMVALAQAVIRRPDVLLLDEPTSSLDLRNQLEVLRIVREIACDQAVAVLTVIHDLGLAARIADQVVVLDRGVVRSAGAPAEVITRNMLREVYRVDGIVHTTDAGDLSVAVSHGI